MKNSAGTESKDSAVGSDNTKFRSAVIGAAKASGQQTLVLYGKPRYKVSVKLKGTTTFTKGSLILLRFPNIFRDKNDTIVGELSLRLWDVTHSFNNSGWLTTLSLEQDEIVIV